MTPEDALIYIEYIARINRKRGETNNQVIARILKEYLPEEIKTACCQVCGKLLDIEVNSGICKHQFITGAYQEELPLDKN